VTFRVGTRGTVACLPVIDDVLLERTGPVARLTINRPERRNALNGSVLAGLRSGLSQIRDDEAIRVVVLTGAGDRAFSAGADLVGPSSPVAGAGNENGPSASERHEARGDLAALFQDLWKLGKPSIARVRGYALAGGMGLALACDLVVAADDAVFGTPEIDVGIWPYMVTVALLGSMSPRHALELMMTGRRVSASEGERLGFVNRVVGVDELDSTVDGLAELLASKPPRALAAGRASFYRVLHLAADDALAYLHPLLTVATETPEAAEGRAAFAERRRPSWVADSSSEGTSSQGTSSAGTSSAGSSRTSR
jgi:enoyl-CoA hydratase/carnithine racemase